MPQRWTRSSGTVDTVCRNGGHGLQERWTRSSVGTSYERNGWLSHVSGDKIGVAAMVWGAI
ncbi:hypothetical protein [Kibdelosporangium philippinense]|uniref:hypothetical protein n=1 Tax=Kibdelosporangium philippinense TaxID=211113 RepID=UPI00361FC3E9